MQVKEYVKEFGGDNQLAAFLKVKPGTVRAWVNRGFIPARHHLAMIRHFREARGLNDHQLDMLEQLDVQ